MKSLTQKSNVFPLNPGRLLSYSKSAYINEHRGHLVVYNANIFNDKKEKIWYGDLDLTLDMPKLRDLAMRQKQTIYVLSESAGRFDNEKNPDLKRAVLKLDSKGLAQLEDTTYHLLKDGVPYTTEKVYNEADFIPVKFEPLKYIGKDVFSELAGKLKRCSKKLATEDVFMNKYDYNLMASLQRSYYIKINKHLSVDKIERSMAWETFSWPATFEYTPHWYKANHVYIRKQVTEQVEMFKLPLRKAA